MPLYDDLLLNGFATLLHECLNLIKKGSAKEIALAAHAIGLLALTTGPGERAQEILEESVPPISQALVSKIVRVTKLGRQQGEDTISEQAANVFAGSLLLQ
ncbi:uncharacterized protein LOC114291082 isoform X2 [Camellia sinensis]|uniref:uncharacterized protein LOC114291082 isoform X2 n=1 Tax=Camellia sinensis TaxID=4442 RepID=UPI0010358320|nr:uncharacterized protein LOC114291082 isoform X2 [Camellia sinensis]